MFLELCENPGQKKITADLCCLLRYRISAEIEVLQKSLVGIT